MSWFDLLSHSFGHYVEMHWRQNEGFLERRGTCKPSSAWQQRKMKWRILELLMETFTCGRDSTWRERYRRRMEWVKLITLPTPSLPPHTHQPCAIASPCIPYQIPCMPIMIRHSMHWPFESCICDWISEYSMCWHVTCAHAFVNSCCSAGRDLQHAFMWRRLRHRWAGWMCEAVGRGFQTYHQDWPQRGRTGL